MKAIQRQIVMSILAALFLSFFPSVVFASVETFANRMQTIMTGAQKGDEKVGVQIVSLNRGDTLYSNDANLLLNPASCTKLVTTAAALKLLGPDFKFHTKFFTDYRPREGVVGKMWIKGYGDPSIVIERLWRIARDLSLRGLKKIEGDIVIDDYYFDSYSYPGYIENSTRAYNSLTGAVSLGFNSITIVVSPASTVGYPPGVAPDTAGPYFRVVNRAKTGPRGSKNTLVAARSEIEGEDIIVVSGTIPVQSDPEYVYRNISNPPLYFGLALKSLLEQNGITVNGRVMRGMMPGKGYLLLDSVSKPLSLIVRDMNKYSNNFIAEQLVKTLGAEIAGQPGTTAKGIRVIENYLSHIDVETASYSLFNGSGLTKNNRFTAEAMIRVLANLYSDHRISPEAVSSLSIAGVDGTVKDRQISEQLKGLARAKTGTLRGVSTLVGTIPSGDGEIIGYAILMNGNSVGWDESHSIQEEMLSAMSVFTR